MQRHLRTSESMACYCWILQVCSSHILRFVIASHVPAIDDDLVNDVKMAEGILHKRLLRQIMKHKQPGYVSRRTTVSLAEERDLRSRSSTVSSTSSVASTVSNVSSIGDKPTLPP